MRLKKFFNKLDNYYSPVSGRDGEPLYTNYKVKYYCHALTFSFEVYKSDRSFTGTPAYKSEIYTFWRDNSDIRAKIIKDIEAKVLELNLQDV